MTVEPRSVHARLPLLAEFEGICHGVTPAMASPAEWRFSGCNHGHAQGQCPRFPPNALAMVRRFTVQSQTETTLSILVLEEENHTPVRWRQVQFCKASCAVADVSDPCEAAQIRAFCTTYLQRFPILPSVTT